MDMSRRAIPIAFLLLAGLLLCTAAYAYTLSTQIQTLRTNLLELEAKAGAGNEDIAKLRKDLDDLKFRVVLGELQLRGSVDLTKTNFQPLEGGFAIAISGVSSHLSGIKISGEILDTQSVAHEQAKFNVNVGGQENEFRVDRVRPGYAVKFSVYVPDVKAKDARFARFEFKESTLRYNSE
jgi:hypothetical protein